MSDTLAVIPLQDFKEGIASVKNFASYEETKYYLNGIYFHWLNDKFYMVATNGYKLGRFRCERVAEEEINTKLSAFILPRQAIAPLEAWLLWLKAEYSGLSIHIKPTEKQVAFFAVYGTKEYQINFDVIDGTFPDYLRVMPALPPEGKPPLVAFNARLLANALKGFGKTPMDWFLPGQNEPSVARDADGKRLAVIMPMRM